MNNKKNVEQLFYDLYNNVKNEKADDREFESLILKHYEIAKLHYDVLSVYFDHPNDKMLEQFANAVQTFIADEIFN